MSILTAMNDIYIIEVQVPETWILPAPTVITVDHSPLSAKKSGNPNKRFIGVTSSEQNHQLIGIPSE